ncbi:MAG: alternative ribosome rescue aminoacyl-tRNA hydrolase ArfB [Betaproteobacteria bacterium]|nr:alternative ribosome rescue aminoacyl-tRNA hydrolase ArfB [Betaproteobacteria bacterium]
MIPITPTLALDESEIELEFVRASGPGGQNVNKVATAVQLRFDAGRSASLSPNTRARLIRLAGRRATTEGVLIIIARRFRTQEANRRDAMQRLLELIRRAAEQPKPRLATKPTLASKHRRLEAKQRRGETKRLRGEKPDSER